MNRYHLGLISLLAPFVNATSWAEPTSLEDNVIVQENRQEGTTDWMLTRIQPPTESGSDAAFSRRPAIEAYVSHTSLRTGQTLTAFVSTDPPAPYQIDLYRMGYYDGKGGRLMRSLGPFDGVNQRAPDDGPNQLIEADWDPSVTLTIPEDWVSGVYLGKLTNLDSGYQTYLVFVVRDDREADLLFQCSDLTWQAYNRWPAWRSLYDWEGNRWHTELGADVGFDRPYSIYYNGLPMAFNQLTLGSGEFLLWEFPLAFWLEREEYDVSYISNLDTHNDGAGLQRARGFLSVGHDEYWTPQMFEHVRQARDAGVSLAFLSGNSVYHSIDLRSAIDGRPHRVFGRSGRFEDEHRLMGASSYGVGMADWICRAPDHWLFDGTGMAEGDAISELVGWEYHGFPLRDDPNLVVLASGEVDRNAPPYAATIYPGPSGNIVFNSGTCWWTLALSSPPGFQNPPNKDFSREDPRVQRMTRNLLGRMIRSPE